MKRIEILKTISILKNEDDEISFMIHGGELDGVKYHIYLGEEDDKLKIEWDLDDKEFFKQKCFDLIGKIIQEDFNTRIREIIQQDKGK